MAMTILPAPAVAHSVSSPDHLPCDQRIAVLYRQRAHAALANARAARDRGNEHALRGYAHKALLWRSFANDWSRKARGGARS